MIHHGTQPPTFSHASYSFLINLDVHPNSSHWIFFSFFSLPFIVTLPFDILHYLQQYHYIYAFSIIVINFLSVEGGWMNPSLSHFVYVHLACLSHTFLFMSLSSSTHSTLIWIPVNTHIQMHGFISGYCAKHSKADTLFYCHFQVQPLKTLTVL